MHSIVELRPPTWTTLWLDPLLGNPEEHQESLGRLKYVFSLAPSMYPIHRRLATSHPGLCAGTRLKWYQEPKLRQL